MMAVRDVFAWMQTLDLDDQIGVDEGGLTLQVFDREAYLEIGGLTTTEEEFEFCECGRYPENCAVADGAKEHKDR
jgi:hypothetical protein